MVDNLRPIDQVGVLIFDNSFQWAVPIRRADDRERIKRLISGIMADGGTQIAPALTEAYQRILPRNAVYKHIVLLTDGISEEGDAMALVAAGAGQPRHHLDRGAGPGRESRLSGARGADRRGQVLLPGRSFGPGALLLRDVEEHTGVTAVEKPIPPKILKQAEILDGVGMESAPPLRGYVRFQTRPTADAILEADKGDPLLVRWQYGLGRAVVFTSDAKNRWAVELGGMAGVRQAVGQHLPRPAAARAAERGHRRFRRRHERTGGGLPPFAQRARTGCRRPAAAGRLRLRAEWIPGAAQGRQGGRRALPGPSGHRAEPGLVPRAPAGRSREPSPKSASTARRRRCGSTATTSSFCGRSPRPPAAVSAPRRARCSTPAGRGNRAVMNLWPGLLALAVALNLVELVLRKWQGLLEFIRSKSPAIAAG